MKPDWTLYFNLFNNTLSTTQAGMHEISDSVIMSNVSGMTLNESWYTLRYCLNICLVTFKIQEGKAEKKIKKFGISG
jgi:hypothetical protein